MRTAHTPTDETRETVLSHARVGTTQHAIADMMGISHVTLAKYYRRELDLGKHIANAVVANVLLQKAIEGDVTAMIFWLKCRARWRTDGDASAIEL